MWATNRNVSSTQITPTHHPSLLAMLSTIWTCLRGATHLLVVSILLRVTGGIHLLIRTQSHHVRWNWLRQRLNSSGRNWLRRKPCSSWSTLWRHSLPKPASKHARSTMEISRLRRWSMSLIRPSRTSLTNSMKCRGRTRILAGKLEILTMTAMSLLSAREFLKLNLKRRQIIKRGQEGLSKVSRRVSMRIRLTERSLSSKWARVVRS